MSFFPLPPELYFSAAYIECVLEGGNTGFGSGTIFSIADCICFGTARHVIDRSYERPEDRRQVERCQIYFRVGQKKGNGTGYSANWRSFTTVELTGFPKFTYADGDNDFAVIKVAPTSSVIAIDESVCASDDLLESTLSGDAVGFIGFPSGAPSIEDDRGQRFKVPVYRQGVLATPGSVPLNVPNVLGTDYGLLDSYAKKGFSGSAVYSLPRRGFHMINFGAAPDRPGALLGIVAGHYRSNDDGSDGIHSGLSYYTRARTVSSTLHKLAATLQR